MATREIITSFILTVVFIIIINEFLGTEEEDSDKDKTGGSYNKKELEKSIQQLKNIQLNM